MKTTPAALPADALPTAKIPDLDKVIPTGNAEPLSETPNVPPRVTSGGRPVVKSQVPLLPTTKYRGLTFHTVGGVWA